MERTTAQWQNCDPHAMARMSPAAIAFAFEDARKDQLALRAEVERLRALLRECEATLAMWADVAPALSLRADIRSCL